MYISNKSVLLVTIINYLYIMSPELKLPAVTTEVRNAEPKKSNNITFQENLKLAQTLPLDRISPQAAPSINNTDPSKPRFVFETQTSQGQENYSIWAALNPTKNSTLTTGITRTPNGETIPTIQLSTGFNLGKDGFVGPYANLSTKRPGTTFDNNIIGVFGLYKVNNELTINAILENNNFGRVNIRYQP